MNSVQAADGTVLKPPSTCNSPPGPTPRSLSGAQYPKGERTIVSDASANMLTSYLSTLSRHCTDDDLLPCTVSFPFQAVLNQLEERSMESGATASRSRSINSSNVDRTVYINALLDQGSLTGDFISLRVVNDLKMMNYDNVMDLFDKSVDRPIATPICSGLDGTCSDIPAKTLLLNVILDKELKL